ncbi:MAG TPA: multiheme c-type cytochrome [Vicinamibacterales bacterium]|nr:multiheme c-type cytochrome [Vicinamibacterales bacterium]
MNVGNRLLLGTTLLFALVSAIAIGDMRLGAAADSVVETATRLTSQNQPAEAVHAQSVGCLTCHTKTDEPTMHPTGTVQLGCADCHGGNPKATTKELGHPRPRLKNVWKTAANPERLYTEWLRESQEYIQFINPGDLRVVDRTCGTCHAAEVMNVRTSMMTHGAMLWGAALYNNGAVPFKNARFGESYAPDGTPQRLLTWPPPTPEETRTKGVLPFLDPLPRWELMQPGNVLRVFERGGFKRPEVGNPLRVEEPGRPDAKLSDRGFGTLLRTDPVFVGLQKTRLLDPLLSFPGTNDQPGDYRGSGCTACHVVYANDRSPVHSAQYAGFGNAGKTATVDPTIDPQRRESGHPIRHVFTRSIPSSQCMTCHMHPGTNMMTTFYGYTWWDNETDGKAMYAPDAKDPGEGHRARVRERNPEGAAQRGRWGDVGFLAQTGTAEFNQQLQHTQFADFHGHGWVYRAVFKRDRDGNLLDRSGNMVPGNDPEKFAKAVHLKDIHLEKGMQCLDCHFGQDNHGNGKLYGETRNAVEIDCVDCHGTASQRPTLITSGPASPKGGTALSALRTPFRERRFYWDGDRLFQRSMMDPKLEWEIKQVADVVSPGSRNYNEKARLAKTIQKDGSTWGSSSAPANTLAHGNERMTCYACHTSWTPTCFGCHLSMSANRKTPMLHNEGLETRNWTQYNFQVLRDDSFFLGRDGTVTGNRIAPVRSACAVLVSSQNQSRSWLYYMQQTISAEGFSGQAFSTFVPHTVRTTETKQCTDCHVSSAGDNNAWMANLVLQGTNFMNFMGHNVWVAAGGDGFSGIAVAERDEPPAIIGSDLHRLAYPDRHRKHGAAGLKLAQAHHHPGENVLDVQQRGEYLYAALGDGGFRVYDIASIDNKDFSERIVTAPVSPLGQRLYVKTKFATAVATPTTLGVDPVRTRLPENEEGPIHPMYGYLYVTDRDEGLIVIGAATLLDGNPANNFLERAVTFNPNGVLSGARRITIAGTYAYVLTDRALVVVSLDDPKQPRVTAEIGAPSLNDPRGLQVQFRYAFIVDRDGLKVLDVTSLDRPRLIERAMVPFRDARNIYLARTYAYVAAGAEGIAMVKIEKPEQPALDQVFDGNGKINDANDIKIGMTNASLFAYVADGRNGLQVVQLFSPETNPNHYGFSPRPTPVLIANYPVHGSALKVSEGIDRDRAVDESGNQIAVFGRRGARPFNKTEIDRLFLRGGKLYTVTNEPPSRPDTLADHVASLWRWLVGN